MKIDRYYQWLPNSGFDNEIVKLVNVYEDSGVMFYEFSNGEVCNEEFVASFTKEPKALQGKMLVELSSRKDTWQFEKITSRTINTGQGDIMSPDGRAVIKEIPPLEDIASAGDSDTVNTSVGRVRLIAPKTMVNSIPPIDYKDYIKVEEKKEVVEIKEETWKVASRSAVATLSYSGRMLSVTVATTTATINKNQRSSSLRNARMTWRVRIR